MVKGGKHMEYSNSLNYMIKLVQSFRDNAMNNYMFIKHYNTLSVSQDKIREIIVDKESNLCFLYYRFPRHEMLDSYQPFLGWIREMYYQYFKEQTPEEFVKNAKVYPLQQYPFAQYIKSGRAGRIEDILITEVNYEKKKILESLVNLYEYIGKRQPMFIVIESLHLANLSGIQFLKQFLHSFKSNNVRIFATYNESYRTLDYITEEWKGFIKEIEKKNLQYEWGDIDTEVTIDAQDVFIPMEQNIEEYLTIANNMFYFLDYEDANHYLNIIYDTLEHDKLSISVNQQLRFLQVLAIVEIFQDNSSRAIQLCERIKKMGKKIQDQQVLYNCNYLSALALSEMEQVDDKVKAHVSQCIEIAAVQKDELAQYKAELLLVLYKYNYWRDIFKQNFDFKMSRDFIRKTKKYGFLNYLSYFYIHCFDMKDKEIDEVAQHKKQLVNLKKGIEIASKTGNGDLIISGYTKNIIRFSERGWYDFVFELSQKRMEAIDKENNLIRKAHMYNGMGYNLSIVERYQNAEENFNESLKLLVELEYGEEIGITLYNSAINKMQARDFTAAIEDLLLLIRIMEMLGIHSLSICDTSKFYAMLGLSSFYVGEDYRCYFCLNRIETYVSHLEHVKVDGKYRYRHDTLFMKYLLRAMLHIQDNKLGEAAEEFEKAKYHMDCDAGNLHFNYPLYAQEMAKYYEILDMEKKRESVLKQCIAYCDENRYRLRSTMLKAVLNRTRDMGKRVVIPRRDLSNEEILEVIEKIAVHKDLEDRKKDISFLTVWQELLNKCNNTEDILPQTFSLLKNHFNLDGTLMIGMSMGQAEIKYKDCMAVEKDVDNVTNRISNFKPKDLERIAKYFKKNRQAILTNRTDKGFLEYKELVEIFGIYQVITLYAAPLYEEDGELGAVIIGYVEMKDYAIANRYLLKEHDLIILKFASQQLHIALERLKNVDLIKRMNSQLSDMAVTDLLTGLYNRQGFEKRMKEDEKKENVESVILYLDLDNFKYYNDTFGHEMGDYVLVRFAQVLEKVVDNIGYAVRYGGDEFVLVLNGKDIEFAKVVAKNIFFMLAGSVNQDVQRKIGFDTIVPKEKLLTCSVGISSCEGYGKITEALNKADKGLYYVKKTSKNNYVVWDEIENDSDME